MATANPLQIRRAGPETRDDLRALLGGEPFGWCWCVAWEVPTWEGWGERTADENRALRESLWKHGKYQGYVFYEGDEPVGWCRCGPRATWPKLCEQFGLDPAEPVHALTCFGLRPSHRGRGLLHEFLGLVLDHLSASGATRVEAFPRAAASDDPDDVWNGPRSIFEKRGFEVVGEVPPRVHMVRRFD